MKTYSNERFLILCILLVLGLFVVFFYAANRLGSAIAHAQVPHTTADHQTRSEQNGNIVFEPQTLPSGSQILLADITSTQSFQIIGPTGEPLVTISLKDGKVTYGKNYTPDAAGKAFWDAIASKYPCTRKAEK